MQKLVTWLNIVIVKIFLGTEEFSDGKFVFQSMTDVHTASTLTTKVSFASERDILLKGTDCEISSAKRTVWVFVKEKKPCGDWKDDSDETQRFRDSSLTDTQ